MEVDQVEASRAAEVTVTTCIRANESCEEAGSESSAGVQPRSCRGCSFRQYARG